MKHIFPFFLIIFFSCKKSELLTLDDSWSKPLISYNQVNENIYFTLINPKDTSEYSDYTISKLYKRKINDNLEIAKTQIFEGKTKELILEKDEYKTPIDSFIESRVTIMHDFIKNDYLYMYTDTIITDQKRLINEKAVFKAHQQTKINGGYLCGSAEESIRWADVPVSNFPKEIDKDSAYFVLKKWTEN